MKRIFIPLAAGLLLAACNGKKEGTADTDPQPDSVATAVTDSTVYGHSIEDFGMSTFAMVTEAGDTLTMDRGENHLYGNIDHAGDRFAVTYSKAVGSEDLVLSEGINLTNLEAITKDYTIANGRLVLQGDTVQIDELTTDSLVAHGEKEYKLAKQH